MENVENAAVVRMIEIVVVVQCVQCVQGGVVKTQTEAYAVLDVHVQSDLQSRDEGEVKHVGDLEEVAGEKPHVVGDLEEAEQAEQVEQVEQAAHGYSVVVIVGNRY